MSELHITGQPKAVFVFPFIPSWNEVIDKARTHWRAGHSHTKLWRAEGYALATQFMRAFYQGQQYLIQECALLVVKVYRPDDNTYDVHNVCIKAIGDGFTEAGIWRDDEWASVPLCLFAWAERDEKGMRTEIEVHELDAYTIDGVAQILPRGRVFFMVGKEGKKQRRVGQVLRRLPGEQLLFDNTDEAFWFDVYSGPMTITGNPDQVVTGTVSLSKGGKHSHKTKQLALYDAVVNNLMEQEFGPQAQECTHVFLGYPRCAVCNEVDPRLAAEESAHERERMAHVYEKLILEDKELQETYSYLRARGQQFAWESVCDVIVSEQFKEEEVGQ